MSISSSSSSSTKGLDIAIILGWMSWVFYSIAHRNPWGTWTKRQKTWYNNTIETSGVGLRFEIYLIGSIIILPLFVLSLWLYTRFNEESNIYIISIILIILSLTLDKIWNVIHWDKKNPHIAYYLAVLTSSFYFLSLCSVLFTKQNSINENWENLPLSFILFIHFLWFIYHAYIDEKWQQFPCLNTNNNNILKRKNNSIQNDLYGLFK